MHSIKQSNRCEELVQSREHYNIPANPSLTGTELNSLCVVGAGIVTLAELHYDLSYPCLQEQTRQSLGSTIHIAQVEVKNCLPFSRCSQHFRSRFADDNDLQMLFIKEKKER